MPMTNAERQAAWRARRQAELEKAKKAGVDPVAALHAAARVQSVPERCATIRRVLEALELEHEFAVRLKGLAAEGKKNAATFSPVTVATLGHELGQLLGLQPIPDHLRNKYKAAPAAKKRSSAGQVRGR